MRPSPLCSPWHTLAVYLQAVGNTARAPPGATRTTSPTTNRVATVIAVPRVTVANAYVFPGFVDAHTHVAYNVLPRWTPQALQEAGASGRSDAYKGV